MDDDDDTETGAFPAAFAELLDHRKVVQASPPKALPVTSVPYESRYNITMTGRANISNSFLFSARAGSWLDLMHLK